MESRVLTSSPTKTVGLLKPQAKTYEYGPQPLKPGARSPAAPRVQGRRRAVGMHAWAYPQLVSAFVFVVF